MDPIQAMRDLARGEVAAAAAVTPMQAAFKVIVGHEGGMTLNPADPGNWTGGAVNRGVLKGTKYGVSAAAFPTLDIANLTLAMAEQIFAARYWRPVCGDSVPPQLALLLADAAYNNGPGRSAQWLQTAVGTKADGQIGVATLAALNRVLAKPGGLQAVCIEVAAQRTRFMGSLSTWATFGLGWSRRLAALPYNALAMPGR